MQQFYVNAMLEADFYMARERNGGQQAMKYDPRVSTPFESKDLLPFVSYYDLYSVHLIHNVSNCISWWVM